jgi:solute carrier family 25 protein 34/35
MTDHTQILTLTLAEQTIKLMRKVEDRILSPELKEKI